MINFVSMVRGFRNASQLSIRWDLFVNELQKVLRLTGSYPSDFRLGGLGFCSLGFVSTLVSAASFSQLSLGRLRLHF